jgi:hypothetical protein
MASKNFNDTELLLITTAIEQLYLGTGEPRFTKEGVNELAKIQAKIGSKLLGITKEEALKALLPLMLEKIPQIKT